MTNFTKCNKISGIYNSSDQIRNFKFKVKLKEINTAIPLPKYETFISSGDQIEQDGDGYQQEVTFSWQEKVFNAAEILHFSVADNCKSDAEKAYNEKITKDSIGSENQHNKIFSYVDADGYKSVEGISTGANLELKHICKRLQHLNTELDKDLKTVLGISDLVVENIKELSVTNGKEQCQNMFILADMNDYESDPKNLLKREHVLFSLSWDPGRGRLVASPDFNDLQLDPYTLEVNYDSRRIFNYSLEHVGDGAVDEAKLAELQVFRKIAQSHKETVGRKLFHSFPMPSKRTLKCLYIVEIISARHFEYDNLYVEYTVDLPYGYSTSDALNGVTQIATTKGTDKVAHFGHIFELCLDYQLDALGEGDVVPPESTIYLEVTSCDSWGRHRTEGYCSTRLPAARPGRSSSRLSAARPVGHNTRHWEMTRFFVGGRHLLEDNSWIGTPANLMGRKLSKLGVKCITTGELLMSVNAVLQSRAFARSDEEEVVLGGDRAPLVERLSAETLFQSVSSVLQAYHQARDKLVSYGVTQLD